MDYKSLVNKDSFKAILLHHLKNQVKTKFGLSITGQIQDYLEKEELVSSELIVTSTSKDILTSEEFPDFSASFFGSISNLLEDGDKYVPKSRKHCNDSQCSSASSVNASSIDFLSPDQFQIIINSLTNGTNAEKLEALGTLYRLPTLEHLIQHFLWSDIENGLYNSLSSDIFFLKDESFRLYIKMLSCPEPKVVQESYLSLIKYFIEIILPTLNSNDLNFIKKCRCAVEIISILNKFLQNISTHWLRYPQSMIESITVQSLSILIPNHGGFPFPIWMCIAMCDPEAKWVKSIMHGHVSRASFLEALKENHSILTFIVEFCDKYCLEESCFTKEDCCQKPHLVTEITHIICFLSHLLQYSEGQKVLSSMGKGNFASWVNVLHTVMNCAYKVCDNACFSCCATVCDVLSKKWHCISSADDSSLKSDELINILVTSLDKKERSDANTIFFIIQCFCESFDSFYNTINSIEMEASTDSFAVRLLNDGFNLYLEHELNDIPSYVPFLYNSCLILLKKTLSSPSTLPLNTNFMEILTKWLLKIKLSCDTKSPPCSSTIIMKHGTQLALEIDQHLLDVSICLLQKPISIQLCYDLSYFETSLNILLEKILKDINLRNSVCPCDISVLACSLSSRITLKPVLNRTTIFRLSSIIWQLNDTNLNLENLTSVKGVLEILMPSIFCDLTSTEMLLSTNIESETLLFEYVLLFPNLAAEYATCEDYVVLALQIISILSTSIHAICALETKFHISEVFFKLQSEHLQAHGRHLIDLLSILRNHILVKLFIIGGFNERNLPQECLQSNDDVYDWPFVESFPVPKVFYHPIGESEESDENLVMDEMSDLKDIFVNALQNDKEISPNLSVMLLKSAINLLNVESDCPKVLNFIDMQSADSALHEEELVGMEMVRRYGKTLNLLTADEEEETFEQLLKATNCLIGTENNNKLDIFVSTVYLICKGDVETAWLFLQNFSKTKDSLFIWRKLLIEASLESPSSKYITFNSAILELCDVIVKKTFPLLYSAFQFCGILPSAIYHYWTTQCYWNYLDFPEISCFLLLNVLLTGEFSLYFFVSVLKHLYGFILQNAHNTNLYCLLIKNPITEFKVCRYFNFMNELSVAFHDLVSSYLTKILKD